MSRRGNAANGPQWFHFNIPFFKDADAFLEE